MTVIIICQARADRTYAPMPWPKEHKNETRERIVRAAAAVFRERGIAEVSVGEIMRRAGLTHGGFYAHFDSKDDLLEASVAQASVETSAFLASSAEKAANPLVAAATAYLSPEHLAHPEFGCPIAAIGPELARGSGSVRQRLSEGIRSRLERLGRLATGGISAKVRRRRAAGALACMVGGIVLARGLSEPGGAELLADCRAFLREALAPDEKETR